MIHRLRVLTLRRRMYRPFRPRRSRYTFHPVWITLVVAVLIVFGTVALVEWKLRPIVTRLAEAQIQNTMTAVVETAVTRELSQRQVGYSDLISIQRDADGTITALTTDMTRINLLRAELLSAVLAALEEVDVSTIRVPLGSLFGGELLWARGAAIHAQSMAVGTASAEFDSELTSAGVNQTLHRIWMDLSLPMQVLLPGGEICVEVQTQLCVAETVIVGQVPQTYLQFDR